MCSLCLPVPQSTAHEPCSSLGGLCSFGSCHEGVSQGCQSSQHPSLGVEELCFPRWILHASPGFWGTG